MQRSSDIITTITFVWNPTDTLIPIALRDYDVYLQIHVMTGNKIFIFC